MSNPGDRWRRSWFVLAVLLVGALSLAATRCSTWERTPGAQPFASASVSDADAAFAMERPDPTGRLLILRGSVSDRTARGLREAAALLKASVGADEPQWEIDDQLTVSSSGIAVADPQGAIQSFLLPGAPAALRVNSQYGAQLTGTAPDDGSRTIFGDAVLAALGSGSLMNSLTVAAVPTDTAPADTVPVETTTSLPATTTTLPATTTTLPATTTTTPPTTTAPPEAQAAEVLKTIELTGVTFASNSAQLTGDSNAILDNAATVLNANPGFNVEIGGHTDATGNAAYNRNLSQQRADAVKAYLVGRGVAAERMSTKGYGPDRPIADNATKDGRAKNRRIEFTPA